MAWIRDRFWSTVDGISDIAIHYTGLTRFFLSDGASFSRQRELDRHREDKLKRYLDSFSGDNTPEDGSLYKNLSLLNGGDSAIRLMRLLPGSDGEEIQCALETSSLDAAQYEALSYVWGNHDPPSPGILCNGKRLHVTPNLALALNSLRLQDDERVLWVDAVCINQGDKDEKAQQVPMMGEVYRRARRVVVYLGEEFLIGRASFEVFRHLHKLHRDVIGQSQTLDFAGIKHLTQAIPVAGFKTPVPLLGALLFTHAFAAAPWFTRTWVVQEVTLGQDVIMMCGRQELEWDVFEKGMITKTFISLHNLLGREAAGELDVVLLRLIALRQAVAEHKQDRSLLALLNEVRSLGATDPLDKVYGILGLLTDTDPFRIDLRPDHEITPGRLYTNVAKALLLKNSSGLNILSVPRSPPKPGATKIPSWVPDWSDSAGGVRPLIGSASRYGAKTFCASGDPASSPPPIVEEDNSCHGSDNVEARLVLQGYVFDRVKALSDPQPASGSATDSITHLLRQADAGGWRQVLESMSAPFMHKVNTTRTAVNWTRFLVGSLKSPNSTSPLHFLWRDLNATYAPTGEKYDVVCMRTLCADSIPYPMDDMVRAFRGTLTIRLSGKHGMWNQLRRLSLLNLQVPHIEPHLIDFDGMMEMMLGRRLMWSGDGYLGAVPASTLEGDAIVLARGCRTPLVLRERKDGNWEVVGDCYVHGIMYGERFESDRCSELVLV